MKKADLDAMDLIALFVSRRIQPLQARARRMWEYTRIDDNTRYNNTTMSQRNLSNS